MSLSSEYPFLTYITGKFVVPSDMSKISKTLHKLLNDGEGEGERERERVHFCCVIFIDVRSLQHASVGLKLNR